MNRLKRIKKKYPSVLGSVYFVGLTPAVSFGADLVPVSHRHLKVLRREALRARGMGSVPADVSWLLGTEGITQDPAFGLDFGGVTRWHREVL